MNFRTTATLSLPAALGCMIFLTPAGLHGQSGILWHNPISGEVSVWLANGKTVEGKDALSWKCDAASGCSNEWRVIGTGRFDGDNAYDIAWHNARTGEVGMWLQAGGAVKREQKLDWKCDVASGCAKEWRAVAAGDFNGDGHADILWHHRVKGELSAWLLNGTGTVQGKAELSWKCDVASGCASSWRPIGAGDFNGDGKTDLIWHNPGSGEVSAWLLNGSKVIEKKALDWKCDRASRCSSEWRPIGVGNSDRDGSPDVFWFNAGTGEVSAWLVDNFKVRGKNDLDWKCTKASGCQRDWRLVAVM